MSSSSVVEQVQTATDGAETQDPLTADGVPIAQIIPGNPVFLKIDDGYGGVFQQYEVIRLDATVVAALNMSTGSEVGISAKLISTTCPKTGRILKNPEDYAQYDQLQFLKRVGVVTGVSAETRRAILTLLELNFLKINPVKFFESLTTEYPTPTPHDPFEPDQKVFVYNHVGTFVSATIVDAANPHVFKVRMCTSPQAETNISASHVLAQLPEGKRACTTLAQLNAFTVYASNIGSAGFTNLAPEEQYGMLAGLMRPFLGQ